MYYVVSIQIMKDDTKAQSIFAYESQEEALSAYHSTMASNYLSTTLKSCSCLVCNEIGGVIKTEYKIFDDPQPEPEPEPNEEA